jgi:pimeloyl-ACP methyl ester carboxylesterase
MSILSEIRTPTYWYTKLAVAIVAVAFFMALFTGTISFYVLYRIVHPSISRIEINSADFPGHPQDFSFTLPAGGQRAGWFFPGFRGAPTIVLCHGYGSSRGELLTLATSLQDRQYNVYLFDFIGHGDSTGHTTLGLTESQELQAALNAISRRDDVDVTRFGLWGTNLGAYAALAVAEHDPRVRAFALDSAYERPDDFLRFEVRKSGLARIPFVERLAIFAFHWENPRDNDVMPLSIALGTVATDSKLYLEANDEPLLALETRELYLKSPEPRQQAELTTGNYAAMSDDAKRIYENRLLGFFLLNLPTANPGAHK